MFHVEHQKSRKKNASCETPAKAEGKMFHMEHQKYRKRSVSRET